MRTIRLSGTDAAAAESHNQIIVTTVTKLESVTAFISVASLQTSSRPAFSMSSYDKVVKLACKPKAAPPKAKVRAHASCASK